MSADRWRPARVEWGRTPTCSAKNGAGPASTWLPCVEVGASTTPAPPPDPQHTFVATPRSEPSGAPTGAWGSPTWHRGAAVSHPAAHRTARTPGCSPSRLDPADGAGLHAPPFGAYPDRAPSP